TYGPRMRIKDARQTFLGWWIRQLLEGREIEVYGDGAQLRDFNYVDDAVEAFLLAAGTDAARGKVLNLGSPEVMRLRDLAQLMIEINGGGRYRVIPFPPERQAIDIGDYYGAYQLAESVLGWTPRTPLRDGIAKTIEYFRSSIPEYV